MKIQNTEINYTPIFSDFISFPMFLSNAYRRIRKNEKIKDTIDNIIQRVKNNNELSKKDITKFKVLTNNKENIFSKFFAEASDLSFHDRIEYCLEQFRDEILNTFSLAVSIQLENDFIKGAEGCLSFYYFKLNKPGILRNPRKPNEPFVTNTSYTNINNFLIVNLNLYNDFRTQREKSVPNYSLEINNSYNARPSYAQSEGKDNSVDVENKNADETLKIINDYRVRTMIRTYLDEIILKKISDVDISHLLNERNPLVPIELKKSHKCKLYYLLRLARKLVSGNVERQKEWSKNVIQNIKDQNYKNFEKKNVPLVENKKNKDFINRIDKDFNKIYERFSIEKY